MVVAKIAIPTQHGAIPGKVQEQDTNFYNLDAIISVGYRVNSKRDTKFRRHCLRNLTFRRRGIKKIRGTIIFREKHPD